MDWELEHRYGPRVHILDDAWLLTALARISAPDTPHPQLLSLLRSVYRDLTVAVAGRELPTTGAEIPTRMAAVHPGEGVWRGEVLDPAAPVVVVDIVRGGIVPSQVCFEQLADVLPIESVRLDHLTVERVTDADERVTGVDLSGSKIGGSIEGATLLVPDPMGATGSTMLRVLEHYRAHYGNPRRVVLMPMIATPEFLRAVLEGTQHAVVYTARLDRGLSSPEVLSSVPGTHWDEERGLDDKSYIVPGAGGMGEVINNAWCVGPE